MPQKRIQIVYGTPEIEPTIVALVPPMTSDTTPVGYRCFASTTRSGSQHLPFYSFNGTPQNEYHWDAGTKNESWLACEFPNSVKVKKISLVNYSGGSEWTVQTFRVQYSDDGSKWYNASSLFSAEGKTEEQFFEGITETNAHKYWNICINALSTNYIAVNALQFYGYEA